MTSSVCVPAAADRDPHALHDLLGHLNAARFTPRLSGDGPLLSINDETAGRAHETHFIEAERAAVARTAAAAPTTADEFVAWFNALQTDGPGQDDALFPWLAQHAPMPAMRWFLYQELAGEAGFDDLVALTQLRLPKQAKLELARNYWDEMGRGQPRAMHGPMLDALAEFLDLHRDSPRAVWQSLAVANLMSGLAANRHYAYQSLGALGVVELTAPQRCVHINAGLKRLGVPARARQYYALHATLDVMHAATWVREVLAPLVADNRAVAHLLAEGALMRLHAGARCFVAYRRVLQQSVRGGVHAA